MSNTNKAIEQSRDTKVIAAIAAHFSGATVFTLGGTVYTAAELQQLLQSRMDAAKTTQAARATWLTDVAAEKVKTIEVASALLNLGRQLIATDGAKSQLVADFGFTPKPRTVKAGTVALAVVKREATRKARHTLGKKQKAGIKGVVTPVLPASPQPQ